jgi:arylsulfatase A-like enzyme
MVCLTVEKCKAWCGKKAKLHRWEKGLPSVTVVVAVLYATAGGCDHPRRPPARFRQARSWLVAGEKGKWGMERQRARSARAGKRAVRTLVDEISRMEVEVGGPFVDLGQPGQNKHIRGGWWSSWKTNRRPRESGATLQAAGEKRRAAAQAARAAGEKTRAAAQAAVGKQAKAVTFSQVRSKRAPLWFYLSHERARAVWLRARSPAPETEVTLLIDGREYGQATLDRRFETVRFDLQGAPPVGAGNHRARFVFSHNPKTKVRAEVDWVWIRTQGGAHDSKKASTPVRAKSMGAASVRAKSARAASVRAKSVRVAPVRLGGRTRRALVAAGAQTLVFYLHPPERSFLVFDYGAHRKARFTVRVAADGRGTAELFSARAKPGTWREAQIDLTAYAHTPVRLELTVSRTEGPAFWGAPEIMVAPKPAPARGASGNSPAGQGTVTKKADAASARGSAGTARKRPRNVVLIVIDTARADVFSTFNAQTDVRTPAHDRLAQTSTAFLRAYDSENWTNPSVASILTGLYPVTHNTQREDDRLDDDFVLLSERLRKKGFATAAFIANGFCSAPFGFNQGWDDYRNHIREHRPHEAEDVFLDATRWIEKHRAQHKHQGFFVYIQTIDPHVPYAVDRKYRRPYFKGRYKGKLGGSLSGDEQARISAGKLEIRRRDLRWIRSLYKGEITYHDTYLARFLKKLRELRLHEETLLVVTNDHGEELSDHGRLGHGHTLYEELIRAPLLFHYPPLFPKGQRIETIVEAVDIVPTILDAFGFAQPRRLEGRSLLSLARNGDADLPAARRPAYAVIEFLEYKRAIRIGDLKLMVSSGQWERFYDLGSDPKEKKDLGRSRPIARRLCEIYLSEALAQPNKRLRRRRGSMGAARRRRQKTKADIAPKLKKKLEAVGYF